LFPKGASIYCRSKIEKHFTIYPDKKNIVDSGKLVPLKIDWHEYMSYQDKQAVEQFRDHKVTFVLGTVFQYFDQEVQEQFDQYLQVDHGLYLPHPRNNVDIAVSQGVVSIITAAPAESFIDYFLMICEELCVVHYNCSAVFPFANTEVRIVDLNSEFYRERCGMSGNG
jgi:hypothetical protein